LQPFAPHTGAFSLVDLLDTRLDALSSGLREDVFRRALRMSWTTVCSEYEAVIVREAANAKGGGQRLDLFKKGALVPLRDFFAADGDGLPGSYLAKRFEELSNLTMLAGATSERLIAIYTDLRRAEF
jgi:hypothetical protein